MKKGAAGAPFFIAGGRHSPGILRCGNEADNAITMAMIRAQVLAQQADNQSDTLVQIICRALCNTSARANNERYRGFCIQIFDETM